MTADSTSAIGIKMNRAVVHKRDKVRSSSMNEGIVRVVVFGDYLCPYCRGLFHIMAKLRTKLGSSLKYDFICLPDERSHPGAELLARAAEAAAEQGRFSEMHDWLYEQPLPISVAQILGFAQSTGLDVDLFQKALNSEETHARVHANLTQGLYSDISVTPTLFIDDIRYDDAWDYHSLLEALRRPIAAQVKRSARVFANLPASAGFILLFAAILALICENTPISPYYRALMHSPFSIGTETIGVSMTIAEWLSEGLLSLFFLLVGLEIRREVTSGALTNPKAAALPVIAAVGGALMPAAIYLVLATPVTAVGWSVPTATDIAFVVGILALLGPRVPIALRVFVAALAVVDDILSILTLAIFYPRAFDVTWLFASLFIGALLFTLNRARVYAGWPYYAVACSLWIALHAAGIHAALAGVVLAVSLPTRPTPAAEPLLAQAATALAQLENVERDSRHDHDISQIDRQHQIWESAGRNLLAASARLISPAERIERALAPWSAYFILPLFAFSATGVDLAVSFHSTEDVRVLLGVILGLVVGKPLGILIASWLAIKAGIGIPPPNTRRRTFIGASCLCGAGYTVALLMADQAFLSGNLAAIAKIGVLIGSVLAGLVGAAVILSEKVDD